MPNFAESMPNPAQPDQQPPKIVDNDIENLLRGIEEYDAAKARDAALKPAQDGGGAAAAIGSMIEQTLGELDRADAMHARENEKDANTNMHERVGMTAAKTVRAILDERLGEAMVVKNDPSVQAYGMFLTTMDTVRRDVRAPQLDDPEPTRRNVAKMFDDFIRQEVHSAFRAALTTERKQCTLEREQTRIQQLMDAIERTGN